ncbi:hypothetical protein D3C77_540990 [compost metagenome]
MRGLVRGSGVQADAVRAFGAEEGGQVVHEMAGVAGFSRVRGDEEVVEPVEALHCQGAHGWVNLSEGYGVLLVVEDEEYSREVVVQV